jgi:hypothetical protein
MSEERRSGEHELERDAAFVRRIAEVYRPAEPAPAARVAFRAALDARIARRASARRWLAGAAAVACALGTVWLRGAPPIVPTAPESATAEAGAAEALLALAVPGSEPQVLPADYQAIDDLLLEGEGV